jgi:hypothetical protein
MHAGSRAQQGRIAAAIRRKEARSLMMEQEKVGKARIVGYGIGLGVFIVLAAWKFLVK